MGPKVEQNKAGEPPSSHSIPQSMHGSGEPSHLCSFLPDFFPLNVSSYFSVDSGTLRQMLLFSMYCTLWYQLYLLKYRNDFANGTPSCKSKP